MDERREQLTPDTADAIAQELSEQCRETFQKVVETDWRLTQHNFLVNAGGSAAVLAFLGSGARPTYAGWALVLFLVGVVASGIEVRALVDVYAALHNDAIRRRSGFMSNELAVRDSVPKPGLAGKAATINHWSGVVSQFAFILGVIVGLWGYFFHTP